MIDLHASIRRHAGPRRAAVPALLAVGAALAAGLALVPFAAAAPRFLGLAVYALVAGIALDRITAYHPHPRFGVGNGVTLVRAGGAAGFAAIACEPGLVDGAAAWAALAAAGVLLALDGVDGWRARRQGLSSAFGARFDMEVDAVLILTLAAIVAGLGKAGLWVLGLGLVRYGFVLAGEIAPWLARPLPPSQRRRAICAAVVAAVGLMLAPPLVPPLSTLVAAAALAMLLASFAIDVAWLSRQPR